MQPDNHESRKTQRLAENYRETERFVARIEHHIVLDLIEHHTSAVAKLMCPAAAISVSYHDHEARGGHSPQRLRRTATRRTRLPPLGHRGSPDLRDALPTLTTAAAAAAKPVPIFGETDRTGVPARKEELIDRKKSSDGPANRPTAPLAPAKPSSAAFSRRPPAMKTATP